jgi:predicted nuclease of predicted toxin-antitoxin system
VYFLDRSLECHALIDALRAAGMEVHVHSQHFAPDETDEVWLEEVARRQWVILTKDKRIRRRPIEKQALIASGAKTFVLTSGNIRGKEMADLLVTHLRRIERIARTTKPPFIAAVTRTDVRVLDL